MGEEEKAKLVAAVKRECRITWANDDTEKEITDITEDAIEIMMHKLGMHEDDQMDFTKPGFARMLLLKYSWYAWNKIACEFDKNYRSDIITARYKYEVKYGEEYLE